MGRIRLIHGCGVVRPRFLAAHAVAIMDLLRLSVLTPHSYANGCRCRECFGLGEYMRDHTGRDHGLPPVEAPLRAVPARLSVVARCTGTMTCDCPSCAQERSERVKHPPRQPKQPWELRAA